MNAFLICLTSKFDKTCSNFKKCAELFLTMIPNKEDIINVAKPNSGLEIHLGSQQLLRVLARQCFYSNYLSKNIAEVIISQQNIQFTIFKAYFSTELLFTNRYHFHVNF